jgi:hypothetical protein
MIESPRKTKGARTLAAILAADIAGYSACMGSDRADTSCSFREDQARVLRMTKAHGRRLTDVVGTAIGRLICAVYVWPISFAVRHQNDYPPRQVIA